MKKLLFAIAGAASFAALAADPTPGTYDISIVGFENYTADRPVVGYGDSGTQGDNSLWTCAAGEDASLVKTYGGDNAAAPTIKEPAPFDGASENAKYLALDTNGSELQRKINADGSAQTIADPLYIDTLVQFTPSESAPTSTDLAGAKLAIWLGVDSENNTTNLYVQGLQYSDSEISVSAPVAYKITNVIPQPGTWYRLTVKAIPAVLSKASMVSAFTVRIDGTEAIAEQCLLVGDAFATAEGDVALGDSGYILTADDFALISAKKVFGSMANLTVTGLTSVGFKGTGAIDDFVVTTAEPDFTSAAIDFTLTWGDLTAVSYQIGDGEPVSLTGETAPFAVRGLAAGDVVKFVVQNADGAKKTLTGTAGTDTELDATSVAFTWADYLGEAVDGAYEIDDLAELKLFQKGVDNTNELTTLNTTFKLTADIALTEAWPGIGVQNGKDIATTAGYDAAAFLGTFDGQNHTISGFQMVNGLDYCGFFNSIYGATIQNLKIRYAGNLFTAGTVQNSDECGATFVGVAKNSTLFNLTTVAGTVSCSKGFGGIVGYLMAGTTVDSCTNNVNLTSLKPNKAGGIAMITQNGTGNAIIRNCQNNGTTTGSNEHGGLVGYIGKDTTIENCESMVADKLMHHQNSTVTVSGVNKGNATVAAYTGIATPGLNFATVEGAVATFVADSALALSGTYKVMGPNAAYAFAEAGSITFDQSLATPTVTAATGFKVTSAGEGTVTYTAAALATPTVTVTGGANATAVWTVNGAVVAAAPATLTEGDTYSVAYTANEGYEFAEGAVTSASGTAGTENIAITISDAVASGAPAPTVIVNSDGTNVLGTVTAEDVTAISAWATANNITLANNTIGEAEVVSYLLGADQVLSYDSVDAVLKITAITQDEQGNWQITLGTDTTPAISDFSKIRGHLQVKGADNLADLASATPVDVAEPATTITVNKKFIKALIVK